MHECYACAEALETHLTSATLDAIVVEEKRSLAEATAARACGERTTGALAGLMHGSGIVSPVPALRTHKQNGNHVHS